MSSCVIATPHHLASGAGMRAMKAGGTAIDGAVAAAAVLAVVDPQNCALGSDLFALLREPSGEALLINASGPVPARADVARLRAAGAMPIIGIDTVTVPGAVAGWGELHARAGRRPWAANLVDATALARDGIKVSAKLATAIDEAGGLVDDAGMRAVFAPNGRRLGVGDVLRQAALAETLEVLAADGARAFYGGVIAERLVVGLSAAGSSISTNDLAAYTPSVEAPVRVSLRSCTLLTAGPNSSGMLLGQALLALEAAGVVEPLGSGCGFLAALFAVGSAQRQHELGDPRRCPQPEAAWLGDDAVASVVAQAQDIVTGVQVIPTSDLDARPSGDTVAVVTKDREGRAVSLIQSVYHGFGAQVLEPSTGILLHNRAAGMSLNANHPNALAPGARPAHSLIPVVVERDGEVLGVLGTMGGKTHAQIITQVLLRLLAGMSADEAVAAPRFAVGPMQEGEPEDLARVEEDCVPAVGAALDAVGLATIVEPRHSEWLGQAQAIWCEAGRTCAGSDPRADGSVIIA